MDANREIKDFEDELRSNSLEEIGSCSSSILNSPGHGLVDDAYEDDDDYEDGINVTLLSTSAAAKVNEENIGSKRPRKEVNTPLVDTANNISAEDKKKGSAISTENKAQKDIKVKLNGAAKKRFKYLVTHGHSSEDARVLAKTPFRVPISDPNKRRRNAELSESNSSDTNPPKRVARQVEKGNASQAKSSVQSRLDIARTGGFGEASTIKASTSTSASHKPSYRDVLNSIKIGILPSSYPNAELTTQQIFATQKAILTKVAEQRKDKIKPKFGNCLFRSGHMIIMCKNQETVTWLKAIIPSIKPWEEASLIAVDENDIPQPEIFVGFFPVSVDDSNEDILAFVESQNEGLNVDAWRILKRHTVKQNHVELILTVDAASMKTLEHCEYTIDYKFGVAYLRKRTSTKTNDTDDQMRERDDEKVMGNAEQSCQILTIDEKPEDIEMCEATQSRTEASGIANIEFVESYNASASVGKSYFTDDQCSPEIRGIKDNGNSVMPNLVFKFDSNLTGDARKTGSKAFIKAGPENKGNSFI